MSPRANCQNLLYATLVVCVIFFQSCVLNLPAVRQYSKSTIAASHSFEKIANDIPQSCVRGVEIGSKGKKIKISNEVKADGKVDYDESYKSRLEICDDLRRSLDGILAVNVVLMSYAEALGKLASNDVITFSAELNSLKVTLNDVKINNKLVFDKKQLSAVFNLTEILSRIAADGYRQKELQATIAMAGDYIGDLTNGLIFIVDEYKLILEDEKNDIKIYQNSLIREMRKLQENVKSSKLEKEAIEEMLFDTKKRIDAINKKTTASDGFKKVLKNITDKHDLLSQSAKSKELDSVLLLKIMQGYVDELIPAINDSEKAF